MKRILASLAAVILATAAAEAQEEELAAVIDIEISPYTEYVWRGIPLTDGPVLQSGYTFAAAGVSFNIWQNVDLDNANAATGGVTEHDYTLTYEFEAGKTKISLGALYYTFPAKGDDPTTEIIVGASFDARGNPSVTLYQDIDDYQGLYLTAGAAGSIVLDERTERNLDVAFSVGFGTANHNAYYGTDKSTLTDLLLTVSSTFELNEFLSITPSLAFTWVLDQNIVDAFEDNDMEASRVVLGFTLAYSF